jgi:hypothetical protein
MMIIDGPLLYVCFFMGPFPLVGWLVLVDETKHKSKCVCV